MSQRAIAIARSRSGAVRLFVFGLSLVSLCTLSSTQPVTSDHQQLCCAEVREPAEGSSSPESDDERLCEQGLQLAVGTSTTRIWPSTAVRVSVDGLAEDGASAGFRRRIDRPPNARA